MSCIALVLCGFTLAAGEDVEELIEMVCEGAADDAQRAGRLVEAAAEIEDNPGAQKLFYRRALDYGLKLQAGYAHAEAALTALEKLEPDKADEWRRYRLTIARNRYKLARGKEKRDAGMALIRLLTDAGDEKVRAAESTEAIAMYQEALSVATFLRLSSRREIMDRITAARRRQAADARVRAMKKALEKNPGDTAARTKLIEHYLLERDNPAEAAKLLTAKVDPELSTVVPLAAKPVEEVAPGECKELGKWYHGRLAKSTPTARPVILERSLKYLERYRDEGEPKGVDLLKTKLLIDQITKEMDKLGGGALLPKGAVQILTFNRNTIVKQGETFGARDLSAGKRHAILHGGKLVPGVAGEAISLDGRREYIDTRIPHTPAPKTVVFWAKCDRERAVSVCLFGHNFRKDDRLYLAYRSGTGRLSIGLGGSAWGNETTIRSDTKWHHYALVWNGQVAGVFFDGVLAGTKKRPTNPGGRYYLGALQSGEDRPTTFWPGMIDEFAIFGRVLGPAEIKKIYEMGKKGQTLKK